MERAVARTGTERGGAAMDAEAARQTGVAPGAGAGRR